MTLKRLFASSPSQTRSRFEATRSEVHELMKRIREAPQEYRQTSPISCEGYLYVQEKRKNIVLRASSSCGRFRDRVSLVCLVSAGPPPFGSSWVKRYCTFVKEQKILHMVTFDHRSGGKLVSCRKTHPTRMSCQFSSFAEQYGNINVITDCYFSFFFQGETESVTLKSCVRKTTDVLDRRFCLDLDITDRYIFADAVSPSQCCRHKSSMVYCFVFNFIFFCSHLTATLHYFNKYFILPRSIALCRFSVKIPAHTSIWIRMSKVIQSVLP